MFCMGFGTDWWSFLDRRHKDLNGTLPMQEDGVASGSQNPAAVSYVVAAHAIAPLTDKQAARDALTKIILEANKVATEQKQQLQAVLTLYDNRPLVAPAVAALGHNPSQITSQYHTLC